MGPLPTCHATSRNPKIPHIVVEARGSYFIVSTQDPEVAFVRLAITIVIAAALDLQEYRP
jgi:hypothetical protein